MNRPAYQAMKAKERGLKIHEGIVTVCPDLNQNLNLFVSDGDVVVAHSRYRWPNGDVKDTFFQRRGPGFTLERYHDDETTLDFTVQKGEDERAVLVVTGGGNRPTGRSEVIPQGHSIVLYQGEVVVQTWQNGNGDTPR